MGESCRQAHVLTLLNALEEIFAGQGRPAQPGHAADMVGVGVGEPDLANPEALEFFRDLPELKD